MTVSSAMPAFAMSACSRAVAAALLLAATASACDRQGVERAQPQENSSADKGSDTQTPGARLDRASAGSPIPAAVLTDPSGKTIDTGALDGTAVLVNLWATWCAPCKREMPQLDALAAEYDGALQVLAISQDLTGAEAVAPFFAQANFAMLEPWLDPDAAFSDAYGQNIALPMTILYDAVGREVWRFYGDRDWADAESRALVDEAL